MKLNIWKSEFLDVEFWRGYRGNKICTMVKQVSGALYGHVRRESNDPPIYRMQSMFGEMLRNRRLASDDGIIATIDNSILELFVSIGYKKEKLILEMQKAITKIARCYSATYVKMSDIGESNRKRKRYGGGIQYDSTYAYATYVMEFIEKIKSFDEPNLILLPGKKLRNIAYTKKRYLRRMRE